MNVNLNRVLTEEELAIAREIIDMPYNLTVIQIARFFQTSKFTVMRWLKSGELPGYKLGPEWRSTREEVLRFLNKKRGVS